MFYKDPNKQHFKKITWIKFSSDSIWNGWQQGIQYRTLKCSRLAGSIQGIWKLKPCKKQGLTTLSLPILPLTSRKLKKPSSFYCVEPWRFEGGLTERVTRAQFCTQGPGNIFIILTSPVINSRVLHTHFVAGYKVKFLKCWGLGCVRVKLLTTVLSGCVGKTQIQS